MTNWKEYKLGDLVEENRGISYGVVQPGVFQKKGGVPILKVNNLTEGKFAIDDADKITEDVEKKHSRTRLKGNEILISVVGSLGYLFKVTEKQIGWNVVRALAVLPIKENINRDWVYYCLKSPLVQNEFIQRAMHTVQATLNLKELKEISIPIPDLPTQTAIAEILSSLDDKIELNNKINQELENLAQTLFKQWFIDFEFPNENGEPYKSSGGEMVDSELGEIPKGWEVKQLKNLIENIKISPKKGSQISDRKYVPIDKMAIKSLLLNNFSPIEEAKSSLVLFEKGDILLGAMRVYFHRVNYAPFAGVTRTTCFVLRPKRKIDTSFLLLLLNQNETIEFANVTSKGTTMPYAVWDNGLAELEFAYPKNSQLIEMYNQIISNKIDIITSNIFENQELTHLRDSLLPKLISGELEVKNVKI